MPIERDPAAPHETGWRWRNVCTVQGCGHRSEPMGYGAASDDMRDHNQEHDRLDQNQRFKDWEAGFLAGLQSHPRPLNPYQWHGKRNA